MVPPNFLAAYFLVAFRFSGKFCFTLNVSR